MRHAGLDRPPVGMLHYDVVAGIPAAWRAVHRRCLAGASESSDGEPFRRPDGRVQWVKWAACPWRNDDGRIGGIILTVEDVSSKKEAEAEAAHLAAVVKNSNDAIVSKTLESIVTSWNAGATRLLGYHAEEMIGRSIDRIFPPERLGEEDLILERIRAGESPRAFRDEAPRQGRKRRRRFALDRADEESHRVDCRRVDDHARRHRPQSQGQGAEAERRTAQACPPGRARGGLETEHPDLRNGVLAGSLRTPRTRSGNRKTVLCGMAGERVFRRSGRVGRRSRRRAGKAYVGDQTGVPRRFAFRRESAGSRGSGKMEFADDGTPLQTSGIHLDITERKRAELSALRKRSRSAPKSKMRLRHAVDAGTTQPTRNSICASGFATAAEKLCGASWATLRYVTTASWT